MPDFVSNEEIVIAARKRLPQGAWDYLVGGSETETTMRRNRQGFDKLAFRPAHPARRLEDRHVDGASSATTCASR